MTALVAVHSSLQRGQRVLRTVCHELLSSHLSGKRPTMGTTTVWLARFVGNRFNILLVNAGRAFLFKEAWFGLLGFNASATARVISRR